MARVIHCCLDLRGFLRSAKFPGGYRGMFQHDDGRPMTPEEAHDALLDEVARGHVVIPFGKACDGFDYSGGGCPGHDVPDAARDTTAQARDGGEG